MAAVGEIPNQVIQARVAGPEAPLAGIGFAGVNEGYVQQAQQIYHLQGLAPGFASEAAVWQALNSRDDAVVIKPSLLGERTDVFADLFADCGGRERRQCAGSGTADEDEIGR